MTIRKTLEKHDQCPAVAVIQAVLASRSLYPTDDYVVLNGLFDMATAAAVEALQLRAIAIKAVNGLKANGEVDHKTIEAFRKVLGVDINSLPDSFWPQVEEA